ncbi:hypothetical protein Q7P37_001791 [Cladosporium fusiforme]
MADESPSLTTATRSQQHTRQKRARTQLSCTPCRTGKLKCDRASPCEPCIKRGREAACTYPPPPIKKPTNVNVKGRIRQLESLVVDLMNQQKDAQPASKTTGTLTDRSGSVISESTRQGPYTEPTPPSDHESSLQFESGITEAPGLESGMEKPFGHMRISENEISYHGASHWQTILSSISDIKDELGYDEDGDQFVGDETSEINTGTRQNASPQGDATRGQSQPRPFTELGMLVGNSAGIAKKEDLIKAMPEKRVADRLLSLWFNSPDPFKPIIHAPTFQEEYKQYWKHPERAPVMWLGLTFGILSLAESFALRDVDQKTPSAKACLARVDTYHSMAAAAAVLADFTAPKKYTLECLILYTAGLRSADGFMKVWLMIGMILRLSLRMGYHRDSKFYSNISPFDGEMRRRVFTGISMIDILISFQLGLPSMVTSIATDTEPPRNLLDRDFNPSTKVLPPGRGIDELTPSSYMRTKIGLVRIFAKAAELSHSTTPVRHEDVMRLDSDLEVARESMPYLLKMPDMSELVTDPPEQLMCRINLALLALKTRIILHRNFMLVPLSQLSDAEQSRGIGTSRQICTESALSVLYLHHSIHAETQQGGKLSTVKFYMGSISTHDFLLAAMVVCLALSQQISDDDELRSSGGQIWCPRQQAMIDALEKSQQIWDSDIAKTRVELFLPLSASDSDSPMSGETAKACKAMSVMLNRVRQHFKGRPGGVGTGGGPPPIAPQSEQREKEETSQVPFLGVVSQVPWSGDIPADLSSASTTQAHNSDATASTQFQDQMATQTDPSGIDFSAIGDMIDGPVPMDWEFWDDQILQQNAQKANQWEDADFGGGEVPFDAYDNSTFASENAHMLQDSLSDVQYSWQDLQDVDLDIRDYGSGGLWGVSPRWGT